MNFHIKIPIHVNKIAQTHQGVIIVPVQKDIGDRRENGRGSIAPNSNSEFPWIDFFIVMEIRRLQRSVLVKESLVVVEMEFSTKVHNFEYFFYSVENLLISIGIHSSFTCL
ncbi:hypothetical protein H5410_046384 [Solanum commersonii]|uniref:Uncharacterized protein n=1 Tax=Solanum commersonii TaxID=4109 RepID=A0A9J5XFI8_SOLCO|nr:hypothetical protein H5410_046384 [Solanum commersonii]